MPENSMNSRKKDILQAVTEDYVSTAEPVGSRTISRKYLTDLSPATIRNEMADLEYEGYLEQPHTSAGRVPSDKGYRFYVDVLMKDRPLRQDEIERVLREYAQRRGEIQSLSRAAAKILADLANCAAVVIAPGLQCGYIKHVQMTPISDGDIMMIVITSSGAIEHRTISIENSLSQADLDAVTAILNRHLRGLAFSAITRQVIRAVRNDLSAYSELASKALEILAGSGMCPGEESVHTDGITKFLEQPEFKQIEKARPVLRLLESQAHLLSLMTASHTGVSVRIGSENPAEELKDCSMISASYGQAGKVLGSIGIVGPTRMDYSKAIALVRFMAEGISEILERTGPTR
ncbi:MAG TPA: heat-inducible transcriptional repressor HrcA [Bacillota bacterium]|nr:heat-inducible transcription repressor HrcA [Bacillota bacterium]HOA15826.1 heat-inducible transcriptional repressor HrcA [Bacillota bacterium]HOG52948.1 heat-inducible transcriptional repressor HrcA [Bacillota bacterium]